MTVSGVAVKANRLYEDGKVEEIPMARVFTVAGDHSTYTVVVAADREMSWCTCPSLVACSHIGAAWLQAGMVEVHA